MRTKDVPLESLFLAVKSGCARLTKLATAAAQEQAGVFGAQALALLALQARGEVRISELAAMLDLQKPATTTLVARLEAEGLVTRNEDRDDARAACVRLTRKGEETAAKVGVMIAGFDDILSEGFTAEELETVKRFLTRIAVLETF